MIFEGHEDGVCFWQSPVDGAHVCINAKNVRDVEQCLKVSDNSLKHRSRLRIRLTLQTHQLRINIETWTCLMMTTVADVW